MAGYMFNPGPAPFSQFGQGLGQGFSLAMQQRIMKQRQEEEQAQKNKALIEYLTGLPPGMLSPMEIMKSLPPNVNPSDVLAIERAQNEYMKAQKETPINIYLDNGEGKALKTMKATPSQLKALQQRNPNWKEGSAPPAKDVTVYRNGEAQTAMPGTARYNELIAAGFKRGKKEKPVREPVTIIDESKGRKVVRNLIRGTEEWDKAISKGGIPGTITKLPGFLTPQEALDKQRKIISAFVALTKATSLTLDSPAGIALAMTNINITGGSIDPVMKRNILDRLNKQLIELNKYLPISQRAKPLPIPKDIDKTTDNPKPDSVKRIEQYLEKLSAQ